jgi:prepilin-type N-terminal cleavage/methylation domain-containing protein
VELAGWHPHALVPMPADQKRPWACQCQPQIREMTGNWLRLGGVRPPGHRIQLPSCRGLTLIETLIVIAIFAVMLGMVLSAFWYAIKTVRSFQQ